MPATPGKLIIDPGGVSTVVQLSGPTGNSLTTYTAQDGASTISMPDTISTIKTYYFADMGPVVISAKVGGVESADNAGGTLTVQMAQGVGVGVAVGFSGTEVANALAGVSGIGTTQTFAEGANIAVGTATGTKIGTATAQKLAFFNSTPIIQRASANQAAPVATATTQTTPYGFATQAQGDAVVTLVTELRAALVAFGLIKGAA